MELGPSVVAWRKRGRHVRAAGRDVFVLDGGPPEVAEAALVLHGFPTSSHAWHRAWPQIASGRRAVTFDFPGYGLSEKPERAAYSLFEQADVACAVLRELGVRRAHVVAHDMGTSVACELVARHEHGLLPFELASLLLMNGSVHLQMARLTPSQKLLRSRLGPLFARLSNRRRFKAQMRRILSVQIAEEDLDAMWQQLALNDGIARLPRTISYLDERERFHERWTGALTRLDVPALVLWGTEDPVAVLAIAERLAADIPGATYRRLEGLGHYPQLEDPARTGGAIASWLEQVMAK